jgi:Tfp pilus assembly protein PilV
MATIKRQKRISRLGQRGDTIVEVLIAVGIASLVLTSAFAITNRNSRAAQDIQEHSTAQKLIETQTERLRAAAAANTLGAAPGSFCFNEMKIKAASDPTCTVDTGGGAVYHQSITPKSSDPSIYEISVTWDTLGGQTATETNYYKPVVEPT